MGLLDEVATAVAKRGSEIVSLLKSGRADEVTDAMLDMGDPVLNTRLNEYLWNNYDLPMDAVSRAERAKKYPTQDMYSGTGEDFPAFNDAAIYATNNPDLAYTYAPSDGGNIMPLVMRAKHGSPVVNAGGANWNRLTPSMREGGPQEPYLPGILRDPAEIAKHGEDILTTRDFEQAAKEQGFSGVTFNDIVDVGGYFSKYFPEGPARDAQRASMKAASEPSRVETRFYPNQVRSRFARFDPRLAHLKNLNAGVAGATAAGAGLLGGSDEANASPIDAIKGPTKEAALRLFRGTSGSAERIKGGIGEGLLFGTPDEDIARLYGDNITQFELPEGAKILTEGTPEFAAVTGRKRGPLLRTLGRGENLTSAANDAIDKAKAAGFDAVQFNSTRDMGVAVLNPKIVRPIGGVAGATAAGAGLLADDNEANAATTAPLRADVTGAGEYSLGYADRLGQLYRVDGGLMTPVGVSTEGITATPDRMEAPPEAQPEPWAIDEALRYYLGPTGIPERLAAVNEMLNPVRGMERAGEASSRMLDPDLGGLERTAAGADMLTEMLGAMLGFGGTKQAVQEAAPAVERGVLDIIDRLNQPGAMPTTYSNPIPGLLGRVEQNTALEDVLRAKYPGVKLSLTGDASKGYKLNQIIVPEEQRGSGVGSAIMRDIADAADQQGATVSLSPSADFGGSVGRLKEFYSRFGFVPNKGKSKDFAISESMYRLPKSDFPGLLPSAVSAPADEVAVRGAEIVDLLKSGRADEVTDAMLDMGDPVANARLNEYLFNSYDLPMDAVSRKARAEQMGFSSALHGTGSDFTAVDPAYFGNGKDLLGSGFYTSTNPSRADVYVPRERTPGIEVRKGYAEGGNVMPLSVREPRPFILEDVQGQSADDIAASFAQDPSFSRSTTSSGVNYVTDVDGNRILLDPMQQKHYAVQNIRKEFGPSEVTTVLSDLGYSGVSGPEALGHRVRVAFDPADVRSRFARFDPRLAHLKNLNAALAAGAPLGLLAMQPDEEY